MNKRIEIALFLFVTVMIAISGCLNSGLQSEPKQDLAAASSAVPAAANNSSVATTHVSTDDTVKCELCHKNMQELTPHVKGGKLCMTCHGSQVHNIHIGPGTVGLQCDTCHGFPPTIPTVKNGTGPGHYSVCENCHAAPPNNTKPSNGNLIVIHLSRGKYCTNCHGTDIGGIHEQAFINASKGVK